MRPTGQPFQGCFLAQSDKEAAHEISFPGQMTEPMEFAGHEGGLTLEQVTMHVPSEQRMVRAGQGKTGARG